MTARHGDIIAQGYLRHLRFRQPCIVNVITGTDRRLDASGEFRRWGWYSACSADLVLLESVPRSFLILVSLSRCAVLIHSQNTDVPGAVAEVTSCVRIVSISARRSRPEPSAALVGTPHRLDVLVRDVSDGPVA